MATFLYRVKVNNALNLKMKVVQFEDVWMGDLGLDVKTECESGLRQKRCGLMCLFAMCAQFLYVVVVKVISGMYVFMSKKSHYNLESWLKEMIVVRVVILARYYLKRQPVVGQIAVFAD